MTPMNSSDPLPIEIPADDPIMRRFGSTMPFSRSAFIGNRSQFNHNSAYVDASHIYGMSETINKLLRSDCKLKMRWTSSGQLLELNSEGKLDMENEARVVQQTQLHMAGDRRANENPGLLTLHTVRLAIEPCIPSCLTRS